MLFLSDNAATVHPAVWAAMKAADEVQSPYDCDRLSQALDERFSDLFGFDCATLWVATGTAANTLGLATLCEPHGAVICHREAHIEMDEAGAAGFYLHGAKLLLAEGEGAKITPATVERILGGIRGDVHQVQPHAICVTQATEYGRSYRPAELAALGELAQGRNLGMHVDGARFANAVAFLGCSPAAAMGPTNTLAFGFAKNGGMNAEAIIFRDPAAADLARYRRKRAGHLQSKGRFLAAQILAMLKDDLWLENARAANAAAAEIASGAGERLLHPVEANEVFLRCMPDEQEALRAQGFDFYDWGNNSARFVASWNSREEDAAALGKVIASL